METYRKMLLCFVLLITFGHALDCNDIGECGQCASTYGGMLMNCRWCPVDQQCHAPGALDYNPCAVWENIKKASECPTPFPPVPTSFDLTIAKAMITYSSVAYFNETELSKCVFSKAGWASLPPTFQCLGAVGSIITIETTTDLRFVPILRGTATISAKGMQDAEWDNYSGEFWNSSTEWSFFNKSNYFQSVTSVVAYYGYDSAKNQVILTFRGTTPATKIQLIAEGLAQMTMSPVAFPGIPGATINPFFAMGASSLARQLGPDYARLKTVLAKFPSAQLMITGHSLGGAMAAVMALDMARLGLATPILYTFGEPRAGNYVFAKKVDQLVPNSFRVVAANDLVPHIPLCDGFCGAECNYGAKCGPIAYKCCAQTGSYHHGTEIWFPLGAYKNGVMCGFRACFGAPENEDASCSNRYITGTYTSSAAHSDYENVILRGFCGGTNGAGLGATHEDQASPIESTSVVIPSVVVVTCLLIFLTLSICFVQYRRRVKMRTLNESLLSPSAVQM